MSENTPESWSRPESVNLPSELRISKFAEARVKEIIALSEFIGEARQGALPSQQLPKHLRRRAVSHNPNRLPKRLRHRHIIERLKSTGNETPGHTKRPSRKYRRRPSNLLSEYNRRQRKAQWLETHIWHAKRFHMSPATATTSQQSSSGYCQNSRWGYKLADYPNDKSFRASYRAISNKCLMQDISFYCCIELNGLQNILLDGFSQITGRAEKLGPSFNSPNALSGRREGFAWIFHPNKYPYEVVGKVSFHWKPEPEIGGEMRKIWIWSHPAFYEEFWEILKSVFNFEEKEKVQNVSEEEPPQKKLKFSDPILEQKMVPKNVPGHEKVRQFVGKSEVSAFLLKDTLNRFRLVGPLSQTILKKTLISSNIQEKKIELEKADTETNGVEQKNDVEKSDLQNNETEMVATMDQNGSGDTWWQTYFDQETENSFWSKFDHYLPGQMPAGLTFGQVVRDPRKMLPPKRGCAQIPTQVSDKEIVDCEDEAKTFSSITDNVPSVANPLWEMEIRDSVTSSKAPDHQINKMRSELLITFSADQKSGGVLPLDSNESRIPVILIQQPGSREQSGFGSGWDIILPAGWGMSFWMNFIFHGARVGGLRERRQLELEMGRLGHLDHCPDSQSGKAEIEREKHLLKTVHLSYPPDKRPNFLKLGSATPFEAPWSILVHDWSKKLVLSKDVRPDPKVVVKCPFYVMREPARLSKWQRTLENLSQTANSKVSSNDLDFTESDVKALLPIRVDIKGKGTLGPNTMICWPSRNDLEQFFEHLSRKNSGESFVGPTEPLQADENEKNRKSLKDKHRKEKILLRKKCKSLKDKLVALKAEKVSFEVMPKTEKKDLKNFDEQIKKVSTELDALREERRQKNVEFSTEMESLWIDDINNDLVKFVPSVRQSSTREIIGYVTSGGTCYRKSHHVGLGFIPMTAVKQLVDFYSTLTSAKNQSLYVLVRQPHSQQYRYAKLSVVTEN